MTFIHLYNVSFTTNFIIQIRDDHIAHLTTKTIVVYTVLLVTSASTAASSILVLRSQK